MARRPDLGFFDDGLDLSDPDAYANAVLPFGQATHLHSIAYRSIAFDYLEDEAIWSRKWVAIGTEHDIPANGDILPYTLGYHGIHVQRGVGAKLEGRFNMAQHGGCRMVPDQCQNGTKTRCSFTSCGYSRDRGPIEAAEEQSSPRLSHQYLGLRPERLLPVQVVSHSSLIFVCLDPASMPPKMEALPLPGLPPSERYWTEAGANWKLAAESLARCDTVTASGNGRLEGQRRGRDGGEIGVVWLYPNVIILTAADTACLVIVQPTATTGTLMRISFFAGSHTRDLKSWWQAELDGAATDAASRQRAEVRSVVDTKLQLDAVAHWGQGELVRLITAMPRLEIAIPMMQPTRSYMR